MYGIALILLKPSRNIREVPGLPVLPNCGRFHFLIDTVIIEINKTIIQGVI